MTAPLRYKHLMIDLETMGTSSAAPIMSMGIVPFSLHPERLEVAPVELWFHLGLSLDANLKVGRKPDGATVEWWLGQDSDAQRELLSVNRVADARAFAKSIWQWKPQEVEDLTDVTVWAKPPMFDITILDHFMNQMGYAPPWHRRNICDVRTVLRVAKFANLEAPFDGGPEVKHRADHDAGWQAHQVVETFRGLYR